ncbi:MAG: AAA family ATPase [bacterium]
MDFPAGYPSSFTVLRMNYPSSINTDRSPVLFEDVSGIVHRLGGAVIKSSEHGLTSVWSDDRGVSGEEVLKAGCEIIERLSYRLSRFGCTSAPRVVATHGKTRVIVARGDGCSDSMVTGRASERSRDLIKNIPPGMFCVDRNILKKCKQSTSFQFEKISVNSLDQPFFSVGDEGYRELETHLVLDQFVDRDDHRNRISTALENCVEEQSINKGLLLMGPSGVGKSRICGHTLKRGPEGLNVLFGTCVSEQRIDPGGLVSHWLNDLIGGDTTESIDQFFKSHPDLKSYEGFIRLILLGRRGPAGALSQGEQLDENIAEFFLEFARDDPLVLAGEDVHRADDFSIRVSRLLTNRTSTEESIIQVLDARPTDRMKDFSDQSEFETIQVDPFTKEEMKQIVDDAFSESLNSDWNRELHDRSEGSIVHIHQLLNFLAECGYIIPTDNGWERKKDSLQFPDLPEVANLIRSRINRLSSLHRRILLTSAVCGNKFPRELLVHLMDVDEGTLTNALNELDDQLFLIVKEETIAFEHSEIRTAGLEFLEPIEKRKLAGKILSFFRESLSGSRYRSLIPEYLEFTNQEYKRREWIINQTHKLLRSWRINEAGKLLEILSDESWKKDGESRVQRARYQQEFSRYHEVAERNLREAERLQQEALEILESVDSDHHLVEALNRLGRILIKDDQLDRAESIVRQAMTMAEDQDEQELHSKAQFMMGWRFEKDRDWDQSIHHYRKSSMLSNNKQGASYANGSIARVFRRKGKREQARKLVKESVDKQTHDEWLQSNPHLYGTNLITLGILFCEDGKWEQGISLLETAVDIGRVTNNRIVLSRALRALAVIANHVGDDREERLTEEAEDRGFPWLDLPRLDELSVRGGADTPEDFIAEQLNRIIQLLETPPKSLDDIKDRSGVKSR